ncbi:hypothetical protein PsorP6_018004 [Peronosclerospora sorghi]|uniref:Uncharacterized protein n=1 Tax=Peronosclerospora sorghi TaxID=230839 RepID=A0ACC0WCW3_9STRA|nr:hypothetical protein PsorP6_018004 [Peronosclerospora sorghi]
MIVLERVVERHEPRIVLIRTRQDVALGLDMPHLVLEHHGALLERLERKDLATIALAHESHFAKRTAANHGQGLEIAYRQPLSLMPQTLELLRLQLLPVLLFRALREAHGLHLLLERLAPLATFLALALHRRVLLLEIRLRGLGLLARRVGDHAHTTVKSLNGYLSSRMEKKQEEQEDARTMRRGNGRRGGKQLQEAYSEQRCVGTYKCTHRSGSSELGQYQLERCSLPLIVHLRMHVRKCALKIVYTIRSSGSKGRG